MVNARAVVGQDGSQKVSNVFGNISAHFVESIKDLKVEEDEILVSFDVTALYPSITQKKAIDLVKDLLMRDEELKEKTKISPRNLVDLYEICVKQTYFVFNNKL